MTHVVLTGAAGRAGRAVLADLLAHGYDVTAVDLQPVPLPEGEFSGTLRGRLRADLTDLGETVEVMAGADVVVHLANIPAPGLQAAHRTLVQNVSMNHAVFTAAVMQRVSRVVWASSETTLGLPFDQPPRYAPVDEAHYPHPESSYALSKVLTETMAEDAARHSGLPFVALRFSNILGPAEYRTFPSSAWADVQARRWNLWGYIDERDAALAVRLALTAPLKGASSFIIAAADTVMPVPSSTLMAQVFPDVPLSGALEGFQTLLSIDHAREHLGFEPQHSWRHTLTEDGRVR
ncbi:NAD(P)-dependent oxidoreductase (plasmid) [Deinococcus sp. KNUC1210]|uniref:NAD-dependent epimerase/dehydratase family protein n=1 Tax=Deinococcus sp. KNUC1210 TaxID=2917691 RepID=UPI001EEF7EA4|nr:NAD(P)-dependent oxidoreductase [Deinococcus sp. KNUC1210]ULH17029.1 NAD(P)-dependent oxidoreductase [Deinococcus sp. KNUC1210]